MTSWQNESVVFYSRMAELQHKLKKSEEERLNLEKKFNSILHSCQAEQEAKIKSLKDTYTKLLEDDRMRCERNDNLMRSLKKIENRASMINAKTDRLRLLRHHYEAYMSRLYPDWKKELGNTNTINPQIMNSDIGNIYTEYKVNVSVFDPLNPIKNNHFNNLPLHTQLSQTSGKNTEVHPENIHLPNTLNSHKSSSLESPHIQMSSDNVTQNKRNMSPKPHMLRRKLFEDIPLSGITSDEPKYNFSSHYESFTPTKLREYIAAEQNHTDGNIIHNMVAGDFEMDQNTSDLLSVTLSDDGTIKDIPKETKSNDSSGPNHLLHSPFMYTNSRYSEINNNDNKYSKSTSTPIFYTPPGIRKPVTRTSSFDFPAKLNQESEKYKKPLLTRRPSILTDNLSPFNGTLQKDIRNHLFSKSLMNENSTMDNIYKKYLMDTDRPYNLKNMYEPRQELLRYTNKINELMEKEQDDEYIKSASDKHVTDKAQKGRSYDSRSVHFDSNTLIEDERLKNAGNTFDKYMNRLSAQQLNSVRNSEPTWNQSLKINDNVKPYKSQLLNSATIDNTIQDEENKSTTNFHSSNSDTTAEKQPLLHSSFSTPSFAFTEYKSPDTKDDHHSTLEDTKTRSHPGRPNKGNIQQISQEECIQFPKEKILEQFPEQTSEQFYRLQVVAEHPQEQADELKTTDKVILSNKDINNCLLTNDETCQSKLPSDYKHHPIKEQKNINTNENCIHSYDSDVNTQSPSQTDKVNENPCGSEKESYPLGISGDHRDEEAEVSRTDNKFYENAIEQLRIETQKSDSLLGSTIHEQELNKHKTGQSSTACETEILEQEQIPKTVNEKESVSNSSVINSSGHEEISLEDNKKTKSNKEIHNTQDSQQCKTDDPVGSVYKNQSDVHDRENFEQTESGEAYKSKQKIKLNESEKLPINAGKANFVDDTITDDMMNDIKIMKPLLPTGSDVKYSSEDMEEGILTYEDVKKEAVSNGTKLNTIKSKAGNMDWSMSNIQNTSNKKPLEETGDMSDYKMSEMSEDKRQNKENEIQPTDDETTTGNNAQIIIQNHEYTTAEAQQSMDSNSEVREDQKNIKNGDNITENIATAGNLQEHPDKINKYEGDSDNEQYTQNMNSDQYRTHNTNVSNQNQDYTGNKEHHSEEQAINSHDHFDESDQVPLYSEPNENDKYFDNVDQQHSDINIKENKDHKNDDPKLLDQQQLGNELGHYKHYYPESNHNQEGNNFSDQQYYSGSQQRELYPDENVQGAQYANYASENAEHYKSYVGEDNQTEYASDQYGSGMNYQDNQDGSNQYEQQQGNYQENFDDGSTLEQQYQQHYDDRQQYDEQPGNYQENYDNRGQYEQEGDYSVNQYEQKENYNTAQYEEQEGNYQQNYDESEQYMQQEGDYQHTYHENQYEQQGDYEKNYDNVNQYEQQDENYNYEDQEYNRGQYEQQEGDYQQKYDENNQFVQQGNYDQNYEQYNLPEESDYRSNMQPSDNLQNPEAEYIHSAEGNELQGDMADNNYRQDLETDVNAVEDEQCLQPSMEGANMQLKKQRSLAKVLESDSDSVNLGKDQYNDDSSEFDFSGHNEQNST